MAELEYGTTRIGKTSSAVFLSNGMGLFLAFFNSIFLTRTLGVTGRGEFAMFSASYGLLSLLLGLGLDTSIRYHLARGAVARDRVLPSLVLFVAIVGVTVFGLAHLNHTFFTNELFLPASKQTVRFEVLLAGVVCSNLLYSGIAAVLAGSQRFSVLNAASVALPAVSVLVFGTMLWLKSDQFPRIGSDQVFGAFLVLQLFNAAALGVVACRMLGIGWTWSLLEPDAFLTMIRYAAITYVANLSQFLNYQLDIWIVQYFERSAALGLYSLAGNLAAMFALLPRAVSTVLLPVMASPGSDVSLAQAARVARILMMLNIFVALPVALAAPWWLPFLYGADFSASAWPFTILLVGCAPFALCVVQAGVLAGINRVDVNMKASTLGLAVTLILDFTLIPKYGINGAAVASSASYLVTTAYVAVSFARIGQLPLRAIVLPAPDDIRYLVNGLKNLLR